MNNTISRIDNNVQDRSSVAWKKICEYVEEVAIKSIDEFSPLDHLGQELYSQIHTLPETISKLKDVKKIWLYGSKLKRIPPEIGEMTSLEYLDLYTSYELHWLPYEITRCKKLKDSRVSTRTFYGNYKNRMGFPRLRENPVRYFGDKVHCSVCRREMTYKETNQLWISLYIATDVLPLLVNLCSQECASNLPKPAKDYVQYSHKGGSELQQPTLDEWEYLEKNYTTQTISNIKDYTNDEPKKEPTLLRLIKKIWEK